MQISTTNENKNEPTEGNNKQGSAATSLINDVLSSDAVLFHNQFEEAYLAEHGDGRQIIKLDSPEFTRWLFREYWIKEQRPLPRDADKQVIQTLSAFACIDGPSHDLFVRLAKAKDGTKLYYDLADGNVVEITSGGWQVVSTPAIMFRRMQQKAQVFPEQDGELGLLRSYVNVASEEDWLLFMVFTVAAFIPGFPHAMLVLHGPQGAGKTTPMRVIKQLVDPSVVQGMMLPQNEKDFVQLADQHAFLFFDNLSSMTVKMSDALARAITGDTFSHRKLYTNNEPVVYKIQNPLAVNGINQVIVKPDLLERSLLIEFRRITQEARIPEDEFWEAFEHDKPQLLGAIFDVLTKAMALYPTVPSENLPRMADFSRWGCAIAEAAGYKQQDFIDAYEANIARQNDEAIDASPLAKAVIRLLKESENGIWQGSPEALFNTLSKRADSINSTSNKLWPRSPEVVTRRLNDIQVNLQAIGIRIEVGRNSRGRYIILKNFTDPIEADELIPAEPQQKLSVVDDDVSMSVTSQVSTQ
jgi:hypothetical protein